MKGRRWSWNLASHAKEVWTSPSDLKSFMHTRGTSDWCSCCCFWLNHQGTAFTSSCEDFLHALIQGDTKKQELLKNPTKIEEIQQKNFIDRNWTITTCLLRDSNPNYQCLKITSCRWCPPLRMHSFNLPLRFPIARCNISAGIPRISSWILCFNSSSVLGRVV